MIDCFDCVHEPAAGVGSTAVLKRNKPLTNGIELEWVIESPTPLMEYRLRYRRLSVKTKLASTSVYSSSMCPFY